MKVLACPYLGQGVELTRERELHIEWGHPELLPARFELLRQTVQYPDLVRSVGTSMIKKLSRCYPRELNGRHVVVVIVDERGTRGRAWIVTAYVARKLSGGQFEWRSG
jgi:hypothetical protein